MIGLEKGFAQHDVFRYQSASIAARKFKDELEARFLPVNAWKTPKELDYSSPIADDYYVACGMSGSAYVCNMLARYEEYYVLFFAQMEQGSMWYEDFQRVLLAIDTQMAICLDESSSFSE
jgi:hypothetical protein